MKRKKTFGFIALSMIAMLGVAGFVAAFPFNNLRGSPVDLSDEELEAVRADREAMREAIASNDYDAWKSLMDERLAQMEASLTEENFQLLVERHQKMEEFHDAMEEARESGDFSKMQELKEEYGVGYHKGMHKGFVR